MQLQQSNTPPPQQQCENIVENFSSYFDVVYANTAALLSAVYKIRYDVFCEELKLEEGCPKDVEKDEFDAYSHHFLLRHKRSGEFAGTVRFVIPPAENTSLMLPFEKYCLSAFNKRIIDPAKLQRGNFGEVSRLAVPARFRKRVGESGKPYIVDAVESTSKANEKRLFPYISVGLYLTCAALFVHRQLDYAFVMVEPRLARSMARVGIKFEQAGDVTDYHGKRAPFYISQSMLAKNLKPEIMGLFYYLKKEVARQLDSPPPTYNRLTG